MIRIAANTGCRGRHRILLVEEFNSLGAVVSCLLCEKTFHANEEELETHYYPFVHYSGDGPEKDRSLFLLDSLIETQTPGVQKHG